MHFLVRFLRKFLVIHVAVVIFAIACYIHRYHKEVNFFVLGHCYITVFITTATMIRIILTNFKTYKMLLQEFFVSFHLIHFKDGGGYKYKMYKLVNKVSYYYTLCLVAAMLIGEFLYNLCPWYHNYKIGVFTGNRVPNSTLDFSVFLTFPGMDPTEYFWFITIWNLIISHICTVLFVGNDLLLSLVVFHIIGHIQILRNNLENIPKPKKCTIFKGVGSKDCAFEIYDGEENRWIHTKLNECVDHHRFIISFTDKLSERYGLMLAVNYMFQLVSCCLLLLECSQGDIEALSRFGPLTAIIFCQLILISCVFEIVGTQSEKLKHNVYDIPWECMDTKNQRTVCIILNRVQTPITITAAGMVPVGVTTMAKILKTTLTYFTFLKSIDS